MQPVTSLATGAGLARGWQRRNHPRCVTVSVLPAALPRGHRGIGAVGPLCALPTGPAPSRLRKQRGQTRGQVPSSVLRPPWSQYQPCSAALATQGRVAGRGPTMLKRLPRAAGTFRLPLNWPEAGRQSQNPGASSEGSMPALAANLFGVRVRIAGKVLRPREKTVGLFAGEKAIGFVLFLPLLAPSAGLAEPSR